jgi:predicted metallopeptidase
MGRPKGGKNKKPAAPKEKIEYWKADEVVEEIGKALISQFHTHLATAKVCYLFRTKAKTNGSKVILGTASRMSDKLKALADFDFIIEIGYDEWRNLNITQKQALIDHELCHCGGEEDPQTGAMKWKILPHDLEEFREIVGRYGFWKTDIKDFVQSVRANPEAVAPINTHTEAVQRAAATSADQAVDETAAS